MNSRQGAGALDAVREAISFYMDLRKDKYDRDRMATSDARADRQLRQVEENALADNRRADEESNRQRIQFQATNFGGAEIPEQDAETWRGMGYGAALEQEKTLPSSRPALPVTGMGQQDPAGMPSPMKTIADRMDAQPTGRTLIRQPESEKSRIAYYNAGTRAAEGAANRGSREMIAGNNLAVRKRQVEGALLNQQVANALRKYGIDVTDVTRRSFLAEQIARNSANVDNMTWDNNFAGGPMAILRFMGPDGLEFPQNTPLEYNPQPPLSGGGTSDWEIAR